MGKKATPAPPDYRAAAEETAEGNLAAINAQTEANRPNQVTPWGTSSWAQDAEGRWTQNISLTPEQQQALQSQFNIGQSRSGLAEDMFGRVGDELGGPMDWSQFNEYQSDIGTGDDARQEAIDAMYGQATSRLDSRMEMGQDSLESQLRNQGLNPGDKAYDDQLQMFRESETDAYNQAMFESIRHGGSEGSRVFGMNRDSAAFGNQVRQAQISEEMQRRGFSLNEINALLTGQQINTPNMPGFAQAGAAPGPDYVGAADRGYQADLDSFNAEQSWANSLMSGAGSAASAYFMFSDRRLKSDIHHIGECRGHRIYSWKWVWGGTGVGVMADEVPVEYTRLHPSGYLMVDYGRI